MVTKSMRDPNEKTVPALSLHRIGTWYQNTPENNFPYRFTQNEDYLNALY